MSDTLTFLGGSLKRTFTMTVPNARWAPTSGLLQEPQLQVIKYDYPFIHPTERKICYWVAELGSLKFWTATLVEAERLVKDHLVTLDLNLQLQLQWLNAAKTTFNL